MTGAFGEQAVLWTNTEHHLRLASRTSNAAFCTVIWLKTLAPSGQTVFSSSLLREKSCAPFNTPRLLTVLKKQKEEKRKKALEILSTKTNFWFCSNVFSKCSVPGTHKTVLQRSARAMTRDAHVMTLRPAKMIMKLQKGANGV